VTKPPNVRVLQPEGTLLAADEALANWMLSRIRERPPEPLPATPPLAVERFWPAPVAPVPVPGCRIESCHPALAEDLPGVETIRIGRSPRGARRGRPSRLRSRKGGRVLRLTSGLEFDHALDGELDGSVERMVEQPIWLRFVTSERARRHRPDLLLVRAAGWEFTEVKFEEEAAEPENEARWPLIGAALNSLGYSYRVVTERHIRHPVRHATVWRIFEDRHTPTPAPDVLWPLLRGLGGGEGRTLAQMRLILPTLTREQAHALVRQGVLAVDLNQPVGDGMRFSRGREEPSLTQYSED